MSGKKLKLTVSGISLPQFLMTEEVDMVIYGFNESNSYSFHARPFVKKDLNF